MKNMPDHITLGELHLMVARLERCACPKHGKRFMEVCPNCKVVSCARCDSPEHITDLQIPRGHCQCDNYE